MISSGLCLLRFTSRASFPAKAATVYLGDSHNAWISFRGAHHWDASPMYSTRCAACQGALGAERCARSPPLAARETRGTAPAAGSLGVLCALSPGCPVILTASLTTDPASGIIKRRRGDGAPLRRCEGRDVPRAFAARAFRAVSASLSPGQRPRWFGATARCSGQIEQRWSASVGVARKRKGPALRR